MTQDFEERLREAIDSDDVEIPADIGKAIADGRRIVRGRRIGWGVGACFLVAAALVVPGLLPRTLPAVPAESAVPAGASPAVAGMLIGTDWTVVRLGGAGLVPGSSITLTFGEGTVSGFGGCNGYGSGFVDGVATNGWYRQDGDRLSIGQVVSTWKGCTDGSGEQESRYFEALTSVQRFVVAGDSLRLFGADDTVVAELERLPVKLERTGWRVTRINGAASVAERPPTLLFRDGSIHASNGCNGISGSYSQRGDGLTMTEMTMSLVLCEDLAQQQLRPFVDALNRVVGAVVEGGRLHLVDAGGATVLEAIPDVALLLAAEKSTWRLDNSSGLWGKGEQTSITLRVDHGQLSGRSGCGDYRADFTRDGNSWSVSAATRKPVPCPSNAGEPADRFLGLLEKVTLVELEGTQLRLVTPTETLVFTRD